VRKEGIELRVEENPGKNVKRSSIWKQYPKNPRFGCHPLGRREG